MCEQICPIIFHYFLLLSTTHVLIIGKIDQMPCSPRADTFQLLHHVLTMRYNFLPPFISIVSPISLQHISNTACLAVSFLLINLAECFMLPYVLQ